MTASATADTIYALASAPGKAGVAVFRLSGPAARAALTGLGVVKPLVPRMATLVELKIPTGTTQSPPEGAAFATLDSALVIYFPAPNSFTGEDIVEIHTHGSRAVAKLLLEALNGIFGCRLAEPGEFARRAFLAGKLDLAQAEGLADLIDAETSSQHAQALRQLGGTTTLRVEALREAVLTPLALLEAYIDFPDEEIPPAVLTETTLRVGALAKEISELLADNGIGEKIREGLEIVILGAPNAGKSSLLNALARRDAAIVSPEAGTTRDLIEVPMEIGGYAVTLIDTAGLRDTASAIEAEGIRRARRRAECADLTLYLIDSTALSGHSPKPAIAAGDDGALIVATKSDLAPLPALPFPALAISVTTGHGIPELIATLQARIAEKMDHHAPPLITRARHREALQEAKGCLQRFNLHGALELACEELRLTARAIGKITGKIAVDDVLDLVFSRFCIGK